MPDSPKPDSNIWGKQLFEIDTVARPEDALPLVGRGTFWSTIVSRDASYRHHVNLDQGGCNWKSNQVEESVLNSDLEEVFLTR
ncbi:hypothetical protein OPV22_004412 [Ensete ventricosum]|uniref:Uncharacterized protein n=1 Tax=Ensete ventricosum TaxID=4639 RepID=A0AAV8S3B7_ENSVE|nr:hypothetical protein OPV22_004412 [Ensete ventricosum]